MPGEVPPPFYSFDPDIGRLSVSTPAYGTAVIAVNRSAFPYGGLELARLYDGQGDPIGTVGARPPAAFALRVTDVRGRRVVSTASGMHRTPRRPPIVVRTPGGVVAKTPRRPRAFAGPFRTLDAVGRRRTGGLGLTTRHHFDATGITERWTVRRRGPRPERRRRLTVGVLAPSWGSSGAIWMDLADGRLLPLPIGASVAVKRVRRFLVESDRGAYWLAPLGRRRGIATAIAVAPQRSAVAPGPTLQVTVARASRFRRLELRARITPVAERPR
jgi:hypothetical protein